MIRFPSDSLLKAQDAKPWQIELGSPCPHLIGLGPASVALIVEKVAAQLGFRLDAELVSICKPDKTMVVANLETLKNSIVPSRDAREKLRSKTEYGDVELDTFDSIT